MPLEVINVRSVEWIADLMVEIKGRLGSRTPREYTVTFDRKGNIRCGYQYVPELGYLYPDQIPEHVKSAAIKKCREAHK